MMAMIERIARIFTISGSDEAFGSSGSEKRIKPYVPILSITPARITEPAVGASVCASGSHVWNGNMGTLTAKPRNNDQNTQRCISSAMFNDISFEKSNV